MKRHLISQLLLLCLFLNNAILASETHASNTEQQPITIPIDIEPQKRTSLPVNTDKKIKGIDAILHGNLEDVQKTMYELMREPEIATDESSTTSAVPQTPTTPAEHLDDKDLTPEDRMWKECERTSPYKTPDALKELDGLSTKDLAIGACKRIVPPNLRRTVATAALLGPHIMELLSQSPWTLISNFVGLLGKDPHPKDPKASDAPGPIQHALLAGSDLLKNILVMLNTANDEQRQEFSDAFTSAADGYDMYTSFTSSKLPSYFPEDLNIADFKKELAAQEKSGGKEAALKFLESNLKEEFQNNSQAIYDEIKSEGKPQRILRGLALIIKHQSFIQEAFKWHSPLIDLVLSKEATKEANSKDRLQKIKDSVETYNTGKKEEDKLDIGTLTEIWPEIDNMYKFIALGDRITDIRDYLFSKVNYFRVATGKKPREHDKYNYETADQISRDINNSWLKYGMKAIQLSLRLTGRAKHTLDNVRTFFVRVRNSKLYTAVDNLTDAAYDRLERVYNSRFVMPVREVVSQTASSCWSVLKRNMFKLFLRTKTGKQMVEEGKITQEQIDEIVGKATEGADPEQRGLLSAAARVVVSSGTGFTVAVKNLIVEGTKAAYNAASDKPFTRNETTAIIADSMVRQLMDEIEETEKKEGLITSEEKDKEFQDAREDIVTRNIAALLKDVREEMEPETKGFIATFSSWGSKLKGLVTSKKTRDDEYLKRFNAILETKVDALQTQLRGEFDILEETVTRDRTYLQERVREKIRAEYQENLKKHLREGNVVDDEDQKEYETELNVIIEQLTKQTLEQVQTDLQSNRTRLTDTEYIQNFNKALEKQIKFAGTQQQLRIAFNALEKTFRGTYQDAIEPDPIRIVPAKPTYAQTTDTTQYERKAYEKLFAVRVGDQKPTPFQEALENCGNSDDPNNPLRALMGFMIESTRLQSPSYRQEIQQTGIRDFYAGLDNPNSITRLLNGAASLNNVLRTVAVSKHKSLESFVKGARITGMLAYDTLRDDFFDTYCRVGLRPENRSYILTAMTAPDDPNKTSEQNAQRRADALEPFLKTEHQGTSKALSNMLQNHLNLPARLEVSLFFISHYQDIVAALKPLKLTDDQRIDIILRTTGGKTSREEIAKMLPALQEYNKALNFTKGRRFQFMQSISYKFKNFFRAITGKGKVQSYRRSTFQLGQAQDFVQAVEDSSWLSRLSDSNLSPKIANPQETESDTLLAFIRQNPPIDVSTRHQIPTTEEEEGTADFVSLVDEAEQTMRADSVHLFVQSLTTMGTMGQQTYSQIQEYINGSSAVAQLPMTELLRAVNPQITITPEIQRRAVCGILLLRKLKDISATRGERAFDTESFNKLIDAVYTETTTRLQNTEFSLNELQDALNELLQDDARINQMIAETLAQDIEIAQFTLRDPFQKLSSEEPVAVRSRSGSDASMKSAISNPEEEPEEPFEDAVATEEERKALEEKERQEAEKERIEEQRKKQQELEHRKAEEAKQIPRGIVRQRTQEFAGEARAA